MQVHTLYNGLSDATRTVIDASVGGALMKKTMDQAYEILEDTANNVTSVALPVLLLLQYIQIPIQIQIHFQYRSSMLLVI